MLNISKEYVNQEPFPHAIIDQILVESEFDSLLNEFPNEDYFNKLKPVMGNRRRLASEDKEFYQFLTESNAWRKFYEYVNSEDFAKRFINIFNGQLRRYTCSIESIDNLIFDQNYYKRKAYSREPGFLLKLVNFLKKKLKKDIKNVPKKYFVHLDLSAAHNGYSREVHTDNRNRIAAMLIYFSGKDEIGGSGGDLILHSHKFKKNQNEYERFPNDEDVVEITKVEPNSNRGVMFLCTNNSYHSVEKIIDAKGWRKFIYLGITTDADNIWI